jgi:hypothetical protein
MGGPVIGIKAPKPSQKESLNPTPQENPPQDKERGGKIKLTALEVLDDCHNVGNPKPSKGKTAIRQFSNYADSHYAGSR